MRKTGQHAAGLRRRVGTDTVCRSTRRALLIALGAGVFVAPLRSYAQRQPAKVSRVGILSSESDSESLYRVRLDALRQGLRELGYEEGRNIAFEPLSADGKYDQLPGLAAELVRRKVSVIVSLGIKAATAAKGATTTIPIILPGTYSDVVALGLATSLARPGGNFTGLASFGPEIMAKRLELLKEILPRATRMTVLVNPANSTFGPTLQAMEITAKARKVELITQNVRSPDDFARVFAELRKNRADAIILQGDTLFTGNPAKLANLSLRHGLPSAGNANFVEQGGLFGYAANSAEMYRRAAVYVDKILKGTKPGDIPIEQPTRFEMIVNLKTAKTLGIKIPGTILVRADKVIE